MVTDVVDELFRVDRFKRPGELLYRITQLAFVEQTDFVDISVQFI